KYCVLVSVEKPEGGGRSATEREIVTESFDVAAERGDLGGLRRHFRFKRCRLRCGDSRSGDAAGDVIRRTEQHHASAARDRLAVDLNRPCSAGRALEPVQKRE